MELSSSTSLSSSSLSSASSSGIPKQAGIMQHMQKLTTQHRTQLTRKFQLAHFVISKPQSHSFYSDLTKFSRDVLNVNLETGYLSDTQEVKLFVIKVKLDNITNPINDGLIKYYSIMSDGSSSAKTMDEKELFLMKTASTGIPKFSVISLEEVEYAQAEGLKLAMENSVGKLNLTVDRKDKELGICTDGTVVNVKMHRLIKEEMGNMNLFYALHTRLNWQLMMLLKKFQLKIKIMLIFITFLNGPI